MRQSFGGKSTKIFYSSIILANLFIDFVKKKSLMLTNKIIIGKTIN